MKPSSQTVGCTIAALRPTPCRALLAGHALREPAPLFRLEPSGLLGLVREVAQHDEAEQHGWQPLEQEQPLPPLQSVPAVELKQRARERAADHLRQRNREHEPRERARPRRGRKPVAEVVDDAGQEPRFGHPEQKAQHVELDRSRHEHHRDRHEPPRDHDARDPEPRPDADEYQIARHLERRVADEEDARAEAVDGVAEGEIRFHLQRRVADVYAVDPRDDVEEQQERQQPPGDLRERGAAQGCRSVAGSRDHRESRLRGGPAS
jgi:hypothetical protein